ncbi:MAG: C25 family cysteine peptidase, partial [Calditrichia bacterium]
MKKYFTMITVLLVLFSLGIAAEPTAIQYADSWGEQGLTLTAENTSGVEINFSIQEFFLEDRPVEGEIMKTLQLPGVFLPNDEGSPDLPGMGRYIAVPQGATARVNIISSRTEVIRNINISPAPRIPLETEDGPMEYHKNNNIYSQDAFYPAAPVKLSEQTQIRGVDVVILGITPFQYNPVKKELIVYRDLKVNVEFEGGTGQFGDNRLRSRWWDPILRDILLNQESLPEISYNRTSNLESQDFEYLIITPDNPDYLAWADSIKNFRTMQGIRTGVVTLTEIGGNTTNAIESYLDNAYNTWAIPPAAVLFMADYGTGPATGNGIISPIYNNYCVSDHIYADVNSNMMADMVVARFAAENSSQLATMVQKFLRYERTPPTNNGFYMHPVTAMGWQTERWFQLCSEIVNGFWEHAQGKQPVRENAIYSGSPSGSWSSNQNTSMVVNYFGPTGTGYIPATPSHLTDWGANATRVNNDINSGAFMLQHRDHGLETGWGEPHYRNTDINGLNNADLSFIWSVNCLTGKFDYGSESFAEKFHRHPNGGALAIVAATEVSYSFVNDAYVWGAFDNMWPDFMPSFGTTPPSRDVLPAFANAAGKYFLQQSNWPYNTSNKAVTYYLFHHFGDAFGTVYSEMPQQLTVNHNAVLFSGQTAYSVTADPGSFIALTVNGEIIGTGEGTGMPLDIIIPPQFPGNDLVVTVTKQNFYRYQQHVQITPASGPYLYVMGPVVNDANLNGNGIPEAGEIVEMQLKLTNIGVEQAVNITGSISCPDTFINILNANTTIAAVDTSDTLITGSFTVEISPNTPHLQQCVFDLHMTADSAGIPNEYTWDQTLFVQFRKGAHIELSENHLDFP